MSVKFYEGLEEKDEKSYHQTDTQIHTKTHTHTQILAVDESLHTKLSLFTVFLSFFFAFTVISFQQTWPNICPFLPVLFSPSLLSFFFFFHSINFSSLSIPNPFPFYSYSDLVLLFLVSFHFLFCSSFHLSFISFYPPFLNLSLHFHPQFPVFLSLPDRGVSKHTPSIIFLSIFHLLF